MRVNITVAFDVVEEIDAGPYSVGLADLEASGMGPSETAGAVAATIEDAAQKARGKDVAPQEPVGRDYPLDPEQD